MWYLIHVPVLYFLGQSTVNLFPNCHPAESTESCSLWLPGMKWSILMCVWSEIPRTNIQSGETGGQCWDGTINIQNKEETGDLRDTTKWILRSVEALMYLEFV